MNRSYIPFIDWLKCLGMTLILYGHLAGWAPYVAVPPIYTKQLGVAFFLFASGFSLSRESRDPWHVAFNRLFEIYLYGITCALLVSAVSYGLGGRLQLSNYYPFLGGINVVLDNFPANPTSWYMGTYLHVIVLWAIFVRRIRVTPVIVVSSLAIEIALRAVLMETAGRYVAYMALPNWSTVFLLGCWYGQRSLSEVAPGSPVAEGRPAPGSRTWAPIALVGSFVAWELLAARLPFDDTFPFMHLRIGSATADVVAVSALVSAVYLTVTWLAYLTFELQPAPRFVRFIARNTLIIFLVHMPLLYLLAPTIQGWGTQPLRSAVYLIVCLPGLALVSEGINRIVQPRVLRDRVYQWTLKHVTADVQTPTATAFPVSGSRR